MIVTNHKTAYSELCSRDTEVTDTVEIDVHDNGWRGKEVSFSVNDYAICHIPFTNDQAIDDMLVVIHNTVKAMEWSHSDQKERV